MAGGSPGCRLLVRGRRSELLKIRQSAVDFPLRALRVGADVGCRRFSSSAHGRTRPRVIHIVVMLPGPISRTHGGCEQVHGARTQR
jgi:hypothetical protein